MILHSTCGALLESPEMYWFLIKIDYFFTEEFVSGNQQGNLGHKEVEKTSKKDVIKAWENGFFEQLDLQVETIESGEQQEHQRKSNNKGDKWKKESLCEQNKIQSITPEAKCTHDSEME